MRSTYFFSSLLEGIAEDLQDDSILDSNFQWSSDISGALGTGAELVVRNLPQGTHTITLKATNSLGLSATDTATLIVVPVSGDTGSTK